MDITGMSEEEYRWFVRECYKNCKLRPGEPVALEPGTIGLILTVVGLLLQVAGALLAPKPKDQESKTPDEETIEGQNVVRRDRFAPKSGFDSFQNVVDMGSVIPIVYCKRHEKGGVEYGGIRVNTNLLWSQILSVGGGQFFRGIFLVGEAGIELDHSQIALGNNTLASYELKSDANAGRVTLYYTNGGGRITKDDYRLGVKAANDPGNFDDGDIYEINDTKDFCQALQPSNQVEFGVYGHIGNNFGYKEGEPFVPCSQWQNRPDDTLERQNNQQRIAEAGKGASTFHTRAGFVDSSSKLEPVDVGDELTYKIYRDTDYDKEFREDGAGSGGQREAVVNCHDIATSISSEQRTYDEAINVGDLYKAGSAIVICTDRTDPFISDVDYDGDGTTVTAKFEVIRKGKVHVWKDSDMNTPPAGKSEKREATICSEHSQLFRLMVGAFSVERAFKAVEVGLHSNVRLQSSGVTNFNSLVTVDWFKGQSGVPSLDGSYQAYIDAVYCSGLDDSESTDDDSYRKDVRPGTYSSSDSRYSFFRIRYRDIDDEAFTDSDNLYGVRSSTGVDTYCYMRFLFTQSRRREFQLLPVASWEIRSGEATGKLYALDAHSQNEESVDEKGFTLEFVGEEVERSTETFTLKAFTPPPVDTFEVCEKRDAIKDVAVVSPGSGYSNPRTYENVQMVGVANSSKRFRCDVVTNSGSVESVSLPAGKLPDDQGFNNNDEFKCLTDSDIGGGSGFRGRVTIGVVEECEDRDGTLQLGIAPIDDNNSYIDSYARISEAFIYAGVSTTATEPEHKISYVNIISENDNTPNYDDLSIVGLNIRSSKELRALDQLSVYCEGGMTKDGTQGGDPIHLFPDVFQDLLTNDRFGTGEFFDAAQIDTASFTAANTWTESRNYFFDGAISEKINLRTWGAERARDFLLDLSVSGGKFKLEPTIRFGEAEPIAAMYSSGNIIEDTLQVNYLDTQDRLDPIVSVRWREERRDSSIDSKGLFPQIRESTVRRNGVSENAPVIQVDLSNFCTNREHAEDRAKLECQSKRYITHAVTFKTVPSQTGIQAGSIIKLAIETVYYEQPQNGAISNTGEVTSWAPISNGSYTALIWDGNTLSTQTLDITDGKAPAFANSVFSIETTNSKADTYKVSSVSFDEDGNVDVEALYWPTNDSGISLMTLDWNNAGEWEIS